MKQKQRYNIGDWVMHRLDKKWVKILGIIETDRGNIIYNIKNGIIWQRDIIDKWEPKSGEWCWFYKKNSNNPVFAKFEQFLPLDNNLGAYVANGFTPNGTDREDKEEFGYFYSCAPFIGELPSNLE